MFQFLFKYPIPVFTKGRFVLLSTWPAWLLPVFIVTAVGALALLIRWRLRNAAPNLRNWRAWIIWLMQSCYVGAAVAPPVAAGNDGGGTQFAAEHHCRRHGRFAQHGLD